MWESGIKDKRLLFCLLWFSVCVCVCYILSWAPVGLGIVLDSSHESPLIRDSLSPSVGLLGLNDLAQRSWITSWFNLGIVSGWGDGREPCSFKSQISTYPPCSNIPDRAHRHPRQLSSSMQVNSIMHPWWALKYHWRRHMVCVLTGGHSAVAPQFEKCSDFNWC